MDSYIVLVNEIVDKDKNDILDKVTILSNTIKDSLQEYYNGFLNNAFTKISNGFDSVKLEFNEINKYYNLTNNDYYRARPSTEELDRKEMFHIPYEKRNIITNQRYSIAGFPCIYLGVTPYTCWEELNRPLPNNFTVSRVKLDKDIKILNFAILPYEVKDDVYKHTRGYANIEDRIDKYRDLLKSYLICLPIIMACSVRVKDTKAPFREEYIIPQMFTQWIRLQGDIDGLQYYSTKTATYSRRNPNLYRNIVIPTKETNLDRGHCKRLSELITLTESINCNDIELFSENHDIDFSKITDQSNGLINMFSVEEIETKEGKKLYTKKIVMVKFTIQARDLWK